MYQGVIVECERPSSLCEAPPPWSPSIVGDPATVTQRPLNRQDQAGMGPQRSEKYKQFVQSAHIHTQI